MINSPDFVKRLEKVIHYYGLTASSFAEKIGVQRSSISHILSERNKPSLEFILKVDQAFAEVDLQWLLYGTGTFPKTETNPTPEPKHNKEALVKVTSKKNEKSLERIIMFYTDGTFKTYSEF